MEGSANDLLAREKDSFIKTTVVALTANFWAHNTQIDTHQMVVKAFNLAIDIWDELQRERASGHKS